MENKKQYKLIACEILYRELCRVVAECEPKVDLLFLSKSLHDAGDEQMRQKIQQAIAETDTTQYDAILLGYARCSNGVAGLVAPEIPLVIPRSHDCIALFFGSGEAYEQYFAKNPGTYYRTTGWTERGDLDQQQAGSSIMAKLGLTSPYEEYVAKYGKENADYIFATLGNWQKNYKQIAYINMGLPIDFEYERLAEREAGEKKLSFDKIRGNMSLLEKLVSGDWSGEEFLVVPPGKKIVANDDGKILDFQ